MESRIHARHPLRLIREVVNDCLADLSPENAERGFRDAKRSNETHASTTDPDARLYRKGKGKESPLCYMGHALPEDAGTNNGEPLRACGCGMP